jgi:hypothetical protein
MEMGEDGGEEGNVKQKKSRSRSDRRADNTSSKILLSLKVRLSCARYLQSACARCKELGGADASIASLLRLFSTSDTCGIYFLLLPFRLMEFLHKTPRLPAISTISTSYNFLFIGLDDIPDPSLGEPSGSRSIFVHPLSIIF